jgi:hypothetical protein
MAKGPIVTDAVEALIAKVYRKYPKWKAPMVREEVDYLLHKDNPKLPPGWPSLSKVQKVLATIRKKANELPDSPQDKPWSTATLDEHPIPPEAIPGVLKVWKLRAEKGDSFTIREAKWAARLSALITDPEKLSARASEYAHLELIYQLIGRPFDTTRMDRLLMGLTLTITLKNGFEGFLPLLAQQEDGVAQIRDLRSGKGKGITIGKEQPPDESLTKEQAIVRAEGILKRGRRKKKGGTK